ncbi:MAG: hypothetical protein LIP77_03980 [Planctomycetes bacterium]|nr:hypothetical protein [Planctomycetota bacterium]
MSTTLVTTVLEIEREAEAILAAAERDAAKLLTDASDRRQAAAKAHADNVKKEIADIEARAAADRERKVRELTASGEAALSAVKNVSDAAFDGGVQYLLKALAGK